MSKTLEIKLEVDNDAFYDSFCGEIGRILNKFSNDIYTTGINHLLHKVYLSDIHGNVCGYAQLRIDE